MPRQVSLLLCWDVFVCRTCLGHNYLVEEKLKFKRGEDVLEEVDKFFYLGDMINCYCGVSEAVSARIGVQGVKWCVNGKQSLSLKQWGKIYQCCVRPVLCTVVKRGNLLLRMK